jgi:hypothetical protein
MRADFTRGTYPDRKRGKRYRRVLVQQSRVLLDSDVAALVDAFDHELRLVTADLGCTLGSPDLGYLVTPGRLLALFEHRDGISASGADAIRDYQRKYKDRYPSLRITGTGTVTVPVVEPVAGPVNGSLAIWYRAEAVVTITIAAGTASTALTLPAVSGWTRATAALTLAPGASLASIAITGDAAPVWIGLVEMDEDADLPPHFWAARGRFHARGLTPALGTATGYPEVSFPGRRRVSARRRRPGRDRGGRPRGSLPRDLGARHHLGRGPRHPRDRARPGRHHRAHRGGRAGQVGRRRQPHA